MDFESLNDEDLVASYPALLAEMKRRGIIRTRNIVGDLGEYLAIRQYNATPGLPKLQAAPPGTHNVDALGRNGDRYTIKSTTGSVTGAFHGLPEKGSETVPEQRFEFVIVVVLNADYSIDRILELTWAQFLKHKRWHSRVRAWNLALNKELLADAKVVFDCKVAS